MAPSLTTRRNGANITNAQNLAPSLTQPKEQTMSDPSHNLSVVMRAWFLSEGTGMSLVSGPQYVNRLNSGEDLDAVFKDMVIGEGWINDGAAITSLYVNLFQREPDAGGYQFWIREAKAFDLQPIVGSDGQYHMRPASQTMSLDAFNYIAGAMQTGPEHATGTAAQALADIPNHGLDGYAYAFLNATGAFGGWNIL